MDRRTFISRAVIGAAMPCLSGPTMASDAMPIVFLIAEHEHLYAADSAMWDAVAEIDDESMRSAPRVAVQVSRLLVGSDANGQKIFKPILAATDEGVTAHYQERARHMQSLFRASPPQSDKWLPDRLAVIETENRAKLAELEACRVARKRHEDECGYTAALEAASASAEKVRHVERLIIDHVPATLQEAALKARWIVKTINDDKSYLLDMEGALEDALSSIGRA